MPCQTAQKLEVIEAINGHLAECFGDAVKFRFVDHGCIEIIAKGCVPRARYTPFEECDAVLKALAEGWKPKVQFAFDFTAPRQG